MLTKQRISFHDKTKNDYAWAKKTINLILTEYSLDVGTITTHDSEYHRMFSNYQLYNNRINQADFERLCNPLGLEVGQLKDEIQPYNKAYNKIQVLLGEELKRPFNFKVTLTNQTGIQSKIKERTQALLQYVEASISPLFNKEEPIPDIQRYFSQSYLDAKEIKASSILNYLSKELHLKDLKNDAFKHALLSAREVVYVGSHNDSPTVEILNPLGVFYQKSTDTKYIQNGEFAGYRSYLTPDQVLDKYADYLSQEDIDKIDAYSLQAAGFDPIPKDIQYGHNEKIYQPTRHILVQHVEWRSQKRVGFLTTTTPQGDEVTTIIDEDAPLPQYTIKTITKDFGRKCTYYVFELDGLPAYVEYKYIPEIWTGTKIGNDIYTMIGPAKHQFRKHDDPTSVKLGYHGFIYNNTNAEPVSLMDRMKPFLYLYFIVMHKLKKLIAQDNGRVFHFDVSMVDPNLGLEKTLYYLKEMNIDFYNPLQNADQPGWAQRGKVSSSTDMSTTQNVLGYLNLLAFIDAQISDVAGISKQREGQVSPTEAVANANTNITMSSVITEIYFNAHSKLWETILTHLLQVASSLWAHKSVTKQYVLDDLSIATLKVEPHDLQDSEFGIFVTSSQKEEEIFQSLRLLSDRLLQTDRAQISDIIRIYKSNSIEELESLIVDSETRRQQQEQAQQESINQQQQDLISLQAEKQAVADERKYEHEMRMAEIESFKFVKDQDSNNNQIPDQLEIEKFKADTALRSRELDIKEKAINTNGTSR